MKNYINRSKARNPGKGKQLEPKVLKQAVLYSISHRPIELEDVFKVSHGVAVRMNRKRERLQLSKEDIEQMTPEEFAIRWYKRPNHFDCSGQSIEYLQPDFKAMQSELAASKKHDGSRTAIKVEQTKINIVRDIYLSQENKARATAAGRQLYSEGHVLRMWREHETKVSPVFRRSYPMGYAAELDFTGITVPYTESGIEKRATLMVMVLPASRMTVVRAIASQQAEDVLPAIAKAFKYYGAVPEVLITDNFRGAVSTPDIYGGDINPKMLALGHFFGMEIIACRPLKPTDKGCVEASVKIVNKIVGARLASECRKGRVFHSLEELNSAITPLINALNGLAVRGLDKTRRELFTKEKELMRIPVSWDYQFPDNVIGQRIPDTAIFAYKGHQYALPAKWSGTVVEVEVLPASIRFYSNGSFITSYQRKDLEKGLSTHENYTPVNHLIANSYELEGVESLLTRWADAIGPDVREWVTRMMNQSRRTALRKNHSCYGVLMLPGANKADYLAFNRCVRNCLNSHAELPSHAILCREWNKAEHSEQTIYDEVFNSENYREICMNYMYGKTKILSWPHSSHGSLAGEEKDYLRGTQDIKQEYMKVSAALGENL